MTSIARHYTVAAGGSNAATERLPKAGHCDESLEGSVAVKKAFEVLAAMEKEHVDILRKLLGQAGHGADSGPEAPGTAAR
jgi:hypothetical protein